ncbi:MAG: DNA cytosine methyltransferase [Streptosporangiaceae bacterium]
MSILPAQHPAGKPPHGALTAGSLCSGYGGLDLAVIAVTGARLAWVAETDRYAAGVLARQWPDVSNLGDVTALDWAQVPPVDLVSAGWPCQDISYAGPGAGITEGTRSGLFSRGAKRTCEAFLCFSWSLPWQMFADSATGVVERLARPLISSAGSICRCSPGPAALLPFALVQGVHEMSCRRTGGWWRRCEGSDRRRSWRGHRRGPADRSAA